MIFFFILFIFTLNNVLAAEFSQAYIRLDSNKPSAPLSGTICTTPSDAGAGVESRIQITFPSDFNLNSNPANFTTNTTNLPDGATQWPGLGSSATSISNKTVILSSADLTDGASLYCFNFSAQSSTTGSTGEKLGNLTTENSSNAIIDSSDIGLNIITSDQIQVMARVPGAPDDFAISLNKLTDGNSFFPGNVIDYEIAYGSLIDVPFPITIEAGWTQGTVEGDTIPTLDLVDYVTSSATYGYRSTTPIVDIQNRRITWSIIAFPANLINQKVNFKLRINDNYSLSTSSRFEVFARILLPLTSTPTRSITSTVNPRPPEPEPPSEDPEITKVSINSISSNDATIYIQTSDLTSVTAIYGTDIDSLPKIAGTNRVSTEHLVRFKDLQADTVYYFKIFAKDTTGAQIESGIYTFRTAKDSTPLLANTESFVATSDNTIISTLIPGGNNYLVIPTNTVFQFKFAMNERLSANSIQGLMRNENVLGIFSYPTTAEANTQSVSLIETLNGIYSGNLKTEPKPGSYDLIAKIYDRNGNLVEQKLAEVKVINKFKVLSQKNNYPIEGARVFLYLYSPSSKRYDIVPSSVITYGNPLYTNSKGELDLVLPQGRYKAEVTDLRHKEKSVEFVIGPENGQEFPVVLLEPSKITPLSLFSYYRQSINDVFLRNTKDYSENLTGSRRFFDLVALASLAGLVVLTIFAFSRRHKIPVNHIPTYFYYLLDRRDRNSNYIHGVVFDEVDNPIHSVNIYLMDKEDEKIIKHTKTNKRGEFIFTKNKTKKYLIMAMAKHYSNSPIFEYHEKNHLKFKITLKKEMEGLSILGRFTDFLSHLAGISFEALLIVSLIFELLFLNTFGVIKTLPFLLITLFTLTLWILHLHNKSHAQGQ